MTKPKEPGAFILKPYEKAVHALINSGQTDADSQYVPINTSAAEPVHVTSPCTIELETEPNESQILPTIGRIFPEGTKNSDMKRHLMENFHVAAGWDRKHGIMQFTNGKSRVAVRTNTLFNTRTILEHSSDAVSRIIGGILVADEALTREIANRGLVVQEEHMANGKTVKRSALAIPHATLEQQKLTSLIPEPLRGRLIAQKLGFQPRLLFAVSDEELDHGPYRQQLTETLKDFRPASVIIRHRPQRP